MNLLRNPRGLLALSILSLAALSCQRTPQSSSQAQDAASAKEDILFSVGPEKVTRQEFQYVFEKNAINRNPDDLRSELDEYLGLYINFKLKVLEAEDQGYPERSSFQQEFSTYRDQLSDSYLTDHDATDNLVREAYNRLKEEINAAHILIRVDPNATPVDTLAAYNRIMNLRNQVVNGEATFAEVAKAESQDPSAGQNEGDLGYFSALQMVYPFENAAFQTPIGGVSMPIRTQFGYHVVKVKDRRPSAGKIQVSHIMIRATEGMPEQEMKAAEDKARDIYQQAQNDGNWFELCRQFSEDVRTKSRGGVLPWFGSGEMVVEFEKAAFALTTPGEVSEPVKTAYGWHVIRLEERQGLKPFEQMEGELRNRISRDSRSQITQKAFINRLMKENNLRENAVILEEALVEADSNLLIGEWTVPGNASLLSKTIFSIGDDKDVSVNEFFNHVAAKQGRSPHQDPQQYMNLLYEQYREDQLLDYERNHLAEKYEDYRYLVKEYRDGILLFQLMDETIWSKAVSDTIGLRGFFNENQNNYRWKERAAALILNAATPELLGEAKAFVVEEEYPTALYQTNVSYSGVVRIIADEQRKTLNSAISLLVNDPQSRAILHVQPDNGRDSAGYRSLVNYLTERGIDVSRIEVTTSPVKNQAASITIFSTRAKSLEPYFNQNAPLNLVVKEGLFQQSDEPVLGEISFQPGTYELTWDNRNYWIRIQSIQPGALKTLSEVRGAVISDYQDQLEKDWLEELRKKYPVSVNDVAVKAVYQAYDLD